MDNAKARCPYAALATRTDEPAQMEQAVKTLLRTLAMLLTMMPAANAAEEEYELEFKNTVCATINKTSDGFLAVRAEPTSNSAMKAKVLSSWEIVLDKKFTSGDWIKARSVYKLVNEEPVNEKVLNGWVHRKYVKIHECVC
jgi:hypothetical protein